MVVAIVMIVRRHSLCLLARDKIQLAGLKKMLFVEAVSCVSVFFTFCWNNIQLLGFIMASRATKKKIFQPSCAVVMTCVFLRICTRM